MKKAVIAMSIACAGALAFADNPQWNTTAWFTGIGSEAESLASLGASNGSWTFPDDNAGVEFDSTSKAIKFELDDGIESRFTVDANSAATAKTAQKIVVKGVFVPCSATDLSTGSAMNANNAQLGFAVVPVEAASENDASTTTTTYYYYAWLGSATADATSPISDWQQIGVCADTSLETELTITISYWNGESKVSFTAVNGTSAAVTKENLSLSSTAASGESAAYKVSSIACTGSGTISALSGVTGIAVASVGDVSYGTADDAITAAKDSTATTKPTVTLLANPDGSVTIPADSTIAIDDNGKNASIVNNGTMNIVVTDSSSTSGGVASKTYTYPVTASGSGGYAVVVNDASKEASYEKKDSEIIVTVKTAKSVLEAIKVGDSVGLMNNETKLREFLAEHCKDAYEQANTSAEIIKTALAKSEEGNTLTKWQCYALGISPTTTLAAGYATDADTENVIIKLNPSVNTESLGNSGDFRITYKVNDTESTDASAIKVPLATGRYSVKVVFSAPTANSADDNTDD